MRSGGHGKAPVRLESPKGLLRGTRQGVRLCVFDDVVDLLQFCLGEGVRVSQLQQSWGWRGHVVRVLGCSGARWWGPLRGVAVFRGSLRGLWLHVGGGTTGTEPSRGMR